MSDSIRYEILEDGTISIETDAISETNHHLADELLSHLADPCGGPVDIKQHRGHHHHQHKEGQHAHA